MDDARWREVDQLFARALELDADLRDLFLARECGDDEKLKHAVERLLALELEAAPFLAEPLAALSAPRMEPEPPGVLDGTRLGPYRLVRQVGHGGMGSVYLARREDDDQQEVAIKLMRRSLPSEAGKRWFHNERQIMARLEHPNIARLYDGGTTAEGLPYLVMERVDGLPIDRFCDRHRLTLRQRLELFGQVCSAVSGVHRALVAHCDLKPSNILVTVDGIPKLLDFGIAKMLCFGDLEEAGSGSAFVPATPGYASPEQLRGEPITTASDVYSLGVILHELLCGSLPVLSEAGSQVVDQKAENPSSMLERARAAGEDPVAVGRRRRTTPEELSRRLRGDLDAIVLRALQRRPEHRYPSVDELSSDLARHLAATPARARRRP